MRLSLRQRAGSTLLFSLRLREGGLLLSFDARVHTVANKELYSAMMGRVRETRPPSAHDKYVCVWNTDLCKDNTGWKLCSLVHTTQIQPHTYSTQHPRTEKPTKWMHQKVNKGKMKWWEMLLFKTILIRQFSNTIILCSKTYIRDIWMLTIGLD